MTIYSTQQEGYFLQMVRSVEKLFEDTKRDAYAFLRFKRRDVRPNTEQKTTTTMGRSLDQQIAEI